MQRMEDNVFVIICPFKALQRSNAKLTASELYTCILGNTFVEDTESDQETVTEEDSQGGIRQSSKTSKKENTVYRTDSESNSQGSGSPYVSKELSPKIEGVVVIADGGENAVVKENISSAVQALFDIEPHKIRIMKKQTN